MTNALLDRAYNFWVHEQPNDDPEGLACQRCALHKEANCQVFGMGDPASRLLLVGEAPGEQEDRFQQPFVGPAGQFLRKHAAQAGVDLGIAMLHITTTRMSCHASWGCAYWTNLIACRPPQNRQPNHVEIQSCQPRLEMIVAAIRPRAILALGAVALTPLTGKIGITKNRGKKVATRWSWKGEVFTVDCIPTFHPAGMLPGRLKEPKDVELFKQDIKAAYDLAYPHGWPEEAQTP